MFKLPYLQEMLYHLLAVDVDLCVAGELQDPVNGKFIKKSLTILTTSEIMVKSLTGLKCPGNHEHQVIEGKTQVHGEMLSRSTFTERYPRKFARRLAMIMGRITVCRDQPYRWHAETFAAEDTSSRPVKRSRMTADSRKKRTVTKPVQDLPWGKRRKCIGKTSPLDAAHEWSQIFDRIRQCLPRVGKRTLTDSEIIQPIQQLIPNYVIHSVIGCRGSSRTMAPPPNVLRGEAPFRRAIFIERGTGLLKAEEEWEHWEDLAKRNLVRPSHESSITVTLFARPSTESAVAPLDAGKLKSRPILIRLLAHRRRLKRLPQM